MGKMKICIYCYFIADILKKVFKEMFDEWSSTKYRSGHGAVIRLLVLQSWGRWFDPPLLQTFGRDFKPRSRLHDLVVSGTLN